MIVSINLIIKINRTKIGFRVESPPTDESKQIKPIGYQS